MSRLQTPHDWYNNLPILNPFHVLFNLSLLVYICKCFCFRPFYCGNIQQKKRSYQWVDLRANLQETVDFPMIHMACSCHFSLKPINWSLKTKKSLVSMIGKLQRAFKPAPPWICLLEGILGDRRHTSSVFVDIVLGHVTGTKIDCCCSCKSWYHVCIYIYILYTYWYDIFNWRMWHG